MLNRSVRVEDLISVFHVVFHRKHDREPIQLKFTSCRIHQTVKRPKHQEWQHKERQEDNTCSADCSQTKMSRGEKKYKSGQTMTMNINPHLPSGPVHLYQLDESISKFRGV